MDAVIGVVHHDCIVSVGNNASPMFEGKTKEVHAIYRERRPCAVATECVLTKQIKALFKCEIFLNFATVALSFVYGKYCPIKD